MTTPTSPPATARDHGLMLGDPPPAGQRVTLANWQDAPFNRWSFLHVCELIPSAPLSRGEQAPAPLPSRPVDLAALPVGSANGTLTLLDVLARTYTDGFLVLHDGHVALEWYFNDMEASTAHLLMSVSKSLTGAAAGVLVEAGALDVSRAVGDYVPELRASAYGTATVRQVLDMTVAVRFSEEYTDPTSEVQCQDRVAGWRPARPGDPAGIWAFLATLEPAGEHGARFQYCSATTDVLGWVLERAGGQRFPALVGRALWSQLGAEHDGYVTVDAYGASFPNGGICVTLRDLARCGQMMLQEGYFNGRQIVPAAWVDDIRTNGDNAAWRQDERWARRYPHGHYRGQWYNSGDARRNLFGIGIHGQHLWIDPAARVVIAKLSTRPEPVSEPAGDLTFAAFGAVAAALSGTR